MIIAVFLQHALTDFSKSYRKDGMETVQCQPLLIFEGIMALYEKRFRDLMDLKIFVMTDVH